MRLLFRSGLRCSRALLLPAIELLLLLLFLLRRPLLYRRHRPYQRMRFRRGPLRWFLLRPEALIVVVLGHLRIPILRRWFISILSRRISLLLIGARLRVGHLSDLRIACVRIRIRRCERTESRLSRLRPSALACSRCALIRDWSRPRWTRRPHQSLFVETSTGLRLPLFDRPRRRWRRSHRNNRTADHGRRRSR